MWHQQNQAASQDHKPSPQPKGPPPPEAGQIRLCLGGTGKHEYPPVAGGGALREIGLPTNLLPSCSKEGWGETTHTLQTAVTRCSQGGGPAIAPRLTPRTPHSPLSLSKRSPASPGIVQSGGVDLSTGKLLAGRYGPDPSLPLLGRSR